MILCPAPIEPPESWPELASLWPALLADFLREIDSPARAGQVADQVRASAWLADLAGSWEALAPPERRAAFERLCQGLTEAAYATRPYCLRCGRCCLSGGPALLAGEGGLVAAGGPFAGQAYTLRAGEPVMDRRAGTLRVLERERIKLREKKGACLFYEPQAGCAVYEQRPRECRALECWRPASSAGEAAGPYLSRRQALSGRALDYLAAQEARCPAGRLVELAGRAARDGSALAELTDLVGFDLHTRRFALDQGHLRAEELDLVLGRPLGLVLAPLGWLVQVRQGRVRLVQSS